MDLRARTFGHIAAGRSCRAAARVFGVSAGKPAPHGAFPIAFPIEIVRAEPDITLKEPAGALEQTHGVSVQLSSIHRALVRAGLSYEERHGALPPVTYAQHVLPGSGQGIAQQCPKSGAGAYAGGYQAGPV